jgi:uncharacterized protein YkwD
MRFLNVAPLVFLSSLSAVYAQESSSVDTKSYEDDSTFQKQILDASNQFRKQHNATELSWNDTLADAAEEWAEGCKFKHSVSPPKPLTLSSYTRKNNNNNNNNKD